MLKELIYARAPPKKIHGQSLNGPSMCSTYLRKEEHLHQLHYSDIWTHLLHKCRDSLFGVLELHIGKNDRNRLVSTGAKRLHSIYTIPGLVFDFWPKI